MITAKTAAELRDLLGKYLAAEAASKRAMEARMKLAPGSTRARSTTANANWARSAEHRDRMQAAVDKAIAEVMREQLDELDRAHRLLCDEIDEQDAGRDDLFAAKDAIGGVLKALRPETAK